MISQLLLLLLLLLLQEGPLTRLPSHPFLYHRKCRVRAGLFCHNNFFATMFCEEKGTVKELVV